MSEVLKNKLIELIEKENIELKYTYASSFQENGVFNYYLNKENIVVPKYIEVPKLIDDDLHLAIIMAHELGHYYAFKKMPSLFTRLIYKNQNSHVIYLNEIAAWKEARKIIKELDCWTDEVLPYFENRQIRALLTYKPQNIFAKIISQAINLTKCWISCYFIISFIYLAVQHGIPIPFITEPNTYEISRQSFFAQVNTLFAFYYLFYIIIQLNNYIRRKYMPHNTP